MVNTGRIWITGTSSLIAFIAYSPQLSGLITSATPWKLLLFNVLVALIYYNYALVVRTDPGSLPSGWKVPEDDAGDVRFCKKCEAPKPPRAHHCRHCKKCILRFDHHCPWVNNCVGHYNYAHFLRFLFYVDAACALHLYLLSSEAFNEQRLRRDPTSVEIALLVANYVACIPVLVGVGLFSLFHAWNLASNTTTIEGSEIDRVKKMVRRRKVKATSFPFNVGWQENITSVLGSSPSEWLLLGKPRGNGTVFPYIPGSDPLRWPPRDPYEALRASWEHEAEFQRSQYPPYHPKYQALEAEDEDDVPLAELQTRSVRIRRGSEGFEIRPRSGVTGHPSDSEDDESSWEELYEKKRHTLYDSEEDEDDM